MNWQIASMYAGTDLDEALSLGWEPFAITIDAEVNDCKDVPRIWIRKPVAALQLVPEDKIETRNKLKKDSLTLDEVRLLWDISWGEYLNSVNQNRYIYEKPVSALGQGGRND